MHCHSSIYDAHTKRPKGQNLPGTKSPKGQNVPGTTHTRDKTSQGTKRPREETYTVRWTDSVTLAPDTTLLHTVNMCSEKRAFVLALLCVGGLATLSWIALFYTTSQGRLLRGPTKSAAKGAYICGNVYRKLTKLSNYSRPCNPLSSFISVKFQKVLQGHPKIRDSQGKMILCGQQELNLCSFA